MANIKSGVYKKDNSKRLKIRPKTDKNMLNFLRLRLQMTANLLSKYIRDEYQKGGLKAIEGLMPAIQSLDKVSNTYLKIVRASKSIGLVKESKEPTLADLILSEDK